MDGQEVQNRYTITDQRMNNSKNMGANPKMNKYTKV